MHIESDRPLHEAAGESGNVKEAVHFLWKIPEKGAIAQCAACSLAFKSDVTPWTTETAKHENNRFKGPFRACTAHE